MTFFKSKSEISNLTNKRFIVRLLCFTSYCRHLSLSVIHCKRMSKRRTVIVSYLLLSDFIMWISCPAAPALAKCSAKHQLRLRRPNFALLLTTISSSRATQKKSLGCLLVLSSPLLVSPVPPPAPRHQTSAYDLRLSSNFVTTLLSCCGSLPVQKDIRRSN